MICFFSFTRRGRSCRGEERAGSRRSTWPRRWSTRWTGERTSSLLSSWLNYNYNLFRSGSASGGYSSGLEAAYHNYGNDIFWFPWILDLPLLLTGMDMESWRSDKYSNGRYKVSPESYLFKEMDVKFMSFQRGSSSSSGGGTQNGYSMTGRNKGVEESASSPYQSGLYDSWKTEWNPTYKWVIKVTWWWISYIYISRDYQTTHYPYPTSSYMTKGGRR